MLIVAGTFRVPPGAMAAAREAMAAMVEASRAEEGCEAYSYGEDVLEPGLIRVFEAWRDRTALDRHFATPHIKAWRAAWAALGIGERALGAYEAADPVPV